MKRPLLYKRLQQLEVANARAHQQREQRDGEGCRRAIEKFELFLRLRGIERGPIESLEEASARALGTTPIELRQLLAAGIDPIHRYFVNEGIV